MPFRVGLDSGTTCSVVSHDHGQHWNGWYSWYTCKDGSELLVPEIDEGAVATFDHTDETWTAQVSSNRQKPAEQPVVWGRVRRTGVTDSPLPGGHPHSLAGTHPMK
jgi:hypothetical protein